jgi:hypothetical protein
MKHRFSRGHREMVPADLQPQLPAFTCPAFIAMHPRCPSAKYVFFRQVEMTGGCGHLTFSFRHGRYDSSERHSKKCPGFKEISSRSFVFPIGITREEYEEIARFRKVPKTSNFDGETVFPSHVRDAVFKFLDMFLKGMSPQSVSDAEGAEDVTSDRQHSFVFDDEGVEGYGDNGDLSGYENS